MTLDEFWDHVKKTRRKDPEAHAEKLAARLAKLPPDEILDFVHFWDVFLGEAYDWNLWGAAYLINGGCSDDGFHYFCQWLILQGRDVFQAALTDPDTLADVVDGDEVECGGSPGHDAWFAATGTKNTSRGYAKFDAALTARHPKPAGLDATNLGDGWNHEDDAEMKRRFPRLWAVYTGDEDD